MGEGFVHSEPIGDADEPDSLCYSSAGGFASATLGPGEQPRYFLKRISIVRDQASRVTSFFLPFDNTGEPQVIIVGSENLSAIIASRDEVIEPSADFDP